MAITGEEQIKIVSNGGLKRVRVFGWVAALDEEKIATCHGQVTGSEDQMSSFRSKATGMAAAMFLFSKVAKEMDSKPEVCLWSNNMGLVNMVEKLLENDPTDAHLMPDHDMYAGIRDSLENLKVKEVGHVKCHKDCEGRALTNTENMSIKAEKLATIAVKESNTCEAEWCEGSAPLQMIGGKVITKKKGICLSISAERKEFEEWQSKKLHMTKDEYDAIDWDAQHSAMNKMARNLHEFAIKFVYHWLPSGKRKKYYNQDMEDPRCPFCCEAEESSLHCLTCQHHAIKKCYCDLLEKIRSRLIVPGI